MPEQQVHRTPVAASEQTVVEECKRTSAAETEQKHVDEYGPEREHGTPMPEPAPVMMCASRCAFVDQEVGPVQGSMLGTLCQQMDQ